MKVMMVTPYFYPKIGGLENYAYNTALGLQKAGHEVFVVTSNHVSKERITEKIDGLAITRLPISFKLSNTPIGFRWHRELKRIIKSEKPDLINAHSPVPFMADMAFTSRGKTPFVITYHAGSLKKGNSILDIVLGIYEKTFLKHMLKKADQIISVYPHFIESLVGSKKSINFIPPGVDTNLFKPSSSKKKMTSDPTILYVGRIEKSSAWKGISVLINAMAIVIKYHPNALLRLVGSGDAVSDYKLQAKKLGIEKNVIFSGALRDQELVNAYQSSTMLVLPSLTDSESFGIVLTEAMACGLPVIGSRVGGIPQTITDKVTGLLFNAGDERALSTEIRKLIEDKKLYRQLATKTRESVVEKFALSQQIISTKRVIERACQPKVLLIHNIISPYRLPVFEELNKHVQLTVLFCKSITKDRVWTYDLSGYTFTHKVLSGKTLGPLILNFNSVYQLSKIKFQVLICNNDPDVATTVLPALFFAKIKRAKIVDWSEVVNPNVDSINKLANSQNMIKRAVVCIVRNSVKIYRLLVIRSSQYHIAFSEGAKKFLINLGVSSSAITRQQLVMPAELLSKPDLSSRKQRNGKRILYIGYLNDRKGVDYLIRAFSKITDPQTTLTIAGTGTTEDMLRELAIHDKRISFVGYVEGKVKANLYSSCDIFVLPTKSDVWGLVINEAIHYGLAIVCSDAAEAKELVTSEAGLVFKSRNEKDLYHKLNQLLNNPSTVRKIEHHNLLNNQVSDPSKMSHGLLHAVRSVQ